MKKKVSKIAMLMDQEKMEKNRDMTECLGIMIKEMTGGQVHQIIAINKFLVIKLTEVPHRIR